MSNESSVTLPVSTNADEKFLPKLIRQFLRYCVVGGLAFVVDIGTLLLLNKVFDVQPRVAAAIGFTLGLFVNYAISVVWVFDTRVVKNRVVEFSLFAVVGILGLLINDQIIKLCTEQFELDAGLAKLPAAAIVLVFNFGMRKVLLFQSRD